MSPRALAITGLLGLYWAGLAFAFCVDWRVGTAFVMFGAGQGGTIAFLLWNATHPPAE